MHQIGSGRSGLRRARLALALLGAGGLAALAQYQLNPQLNTEVYGRGLGTVRYGTGALPGSTALSNLPFYRPALPSEYRNQVFLSGALRSDIRGQYLATGPLAPAGSITYIPTVARPYGSAAPYGSTGLPYPASSVSQRSAPRAPGSGPLPTGSIRHATGLQTTSPITGRQAISPISGLQPSTPISRPRTPALRIPPPVTSQPAVGIKPPLASMSYGSLRYGR